ncbi:MAG: hypothetical protein AABX52_03565 [Nanoarchaeota archaeon]
MKIIGINQHQTCRTQRKKYKPISRGQLEVPLNWLFTLIAGAIILVTFFAFIQKQKAANELSIAESIISDLTAISSKASTSKGTSQLIEFPEIDVLFACTQDCSCTLSIGAVNKPFGETIIFSPPIIRGPNMILYAFDWKVPFRVTNFLAITNNRIKYVIVVPHMTPEIDRILSILPGNININISTGTAAILAKNIRQSSGRTRFIYFDSGQCNQFRNEEKDISCLEVNTETKKLTFYYKNKRGQYLGPITASYINEGDLIAAFFSEHPDQYSCNMNTAYNKLSNIASLYAIRAAALNTPTCQLGYDQVVINLNSLSHAARRRDSTQILDFYNKINNLSKEYFGGSCPEIY